MIVGTILNLINRGDAITWPACDPPSEVAACLSVAYAVGIHGAVSTSSRMEV
ncbi:hypothetical protein [Phenylobacterium sp.]|uniref:hypothetical protein n=1 Tax=Phenylobacterium sp. TaxID=1871053 RepID=UPI0035258848